MASYENGENDYYHFDQDSLNRFLSSAMEQASNNQDEEEESYVGTSLAMLESMRQQTQVSARTTSLQQPSTTPPEFDIELFLDLIKTYECIWNTSIKSYKDKNARKNAWEIIRDAFGGEKDGKILDLDFLEARAIAICYTV